jgi:hypothetical protein
MALAVHCDTGDGLLAHTEVIDIIALSAFNVSRKSPSAECNFISTVLAQSGTL